MLRIEHVAIWTNDLEALKTFYCEVMGGKSGPMYHNSGTGFMSYFVSIGDGARIELMTKPRLSDSPDGAAVGYAHLAFALDDEDAVDNMLKVLEMKGVKVVGAPRMTGDGYYECIVTDPDGNRIELVADTIQRPLLI